MTTVTFHKTKDGVIKGFQSKGHAGYANAGYRLCFHFHFSDQYDKRVRTANGGWLSGGSR